jgi:hypothetical protein
MPNGVVAPAAATLNREEAHIRPIPNNTLDLKSEEVAALATTLENSPTPEGAVEVVTSAMTLNLKGEEIPPGPAWLPHPLLRPVSPMTLNLESEEVPPRPAWLPHPLLRPVSPNLKGEEVPPRPARLPHPLLRPSHRRVPHAFPAPLWEQRGRG